jgi:hypothetical protein
MVCIQNGLTVSLSFSLAGLAQHSHNTFLQYVTHSRTNRAYHYSNAILKAWVYGQSGSGTFPRSEDTHGV